MFGTIATDYYKPLFLLLFAFALAIPCSFVTAQPALVAGEGALAAAPTPSLSTQAAVSKKAASRFVGTYKRVVYTDKEFYTPYGSVPPGVKYSTSVLKVYKVKKGEVTFAYAYISLAMATGYVKTNKVTVKPRNGRAAFTYRATNGERGKGAIRFMPDGSIVLKLTTTQPSGVNTLSFYKAMTFKKGTQVFRWKRGLSFSARCG